MLKDLQESVIKTYNFDIVGNSIVFQLELLENGECKEFFVEFLSTYYFINNTSKNRKNFIPYDLEDYLEFSSINIIRNAKIQPSDEIGKWLTQYSSELNISVEICNKLLLIEAGSVKINGVEYLIE
jgi:hypothetical protein